VHGIDTDPKDNASAAVGGTTLDVNFGNLFPLGDDEIAQSLIHEMMHAAGYTHPKRRDFDPASPGAPIDVPGDGGPYYGTPPLRAEFCIAGSQSDTTCDGTCVAPPGGPRITSIMANPPGADIDGEYVVVGNATGLPIHVDGWTLKDRANHEFVFPAHTIAAGGDVVVWTKAGMNDTRNLFWGRRQAVWNNTGDLATLSDSSGRVVSQYSY